MAAKKSKPRKTARKGWTFTCELSSSLEPTKNHPLAGLTPEQRTELRIKTLADILLRVAIEKVTGSNKQSGTS